MKDCVRFAPMLDAREGELSKDEAAALAAHLDSCARCQAEKADLEATDGLVADALMARANARDFAPFVDQVMARVGAAEPVRAGLLAWFTRHRRAVFAWAVPFVAAAAVLMYVRRDGEPRQIAQLEVSAEGDATMVLQTSDGPVVLLSEERT
jgi:anti-sigma factor RsiW